MSGYVQGRAREKFLSAPGARFVQRDADGSFVVLIPEYDAPNPADRRAGSFRTTVTIDGSSFFPKRFSGKIIGDGCDTGPAQVKAFGQATSRVRPVWRKGYEYSTTFHPYAGQQGSPCWLVTEVIIYVPLVEKATMLGYGAREFPFSPPTGAGDRFQVVTVRLVKGLTSRSMFTGGQPIDPAWTAPR